MKKLVLNKGLSYSVRGFSCYKGKPFLIDDEMAEKLLRTGRFKKLEMVEVDSSDVEDNQGVELSAEAIEKMRKDELITLAKEKEIDLTGCEKKEEIVERIKGVLGFVNMTDVFGE